MMSSSVEAGKDNQEHEMVSHPCPALADTLFLSQADRIYTQASTQTAYFYNIDDDNNSFCLYLFQLAQILPTEENFLLCFRQFVGSSAEFMAAWRKYDTDRSGYIEANELKGFLSDLLKKANRHYDDKKLNEYTQTILKMFDLNGDGKLGLSEMARLLPVEENFLLKFQNFKLSAEEFEAIFTYYDKDGNGYIDEHELDALLRDLYQKHKMVVDPQNLSSSKKSIMALSDGGKLFRTELEIVLCKDPSV
uniref:Calretinin-like n=2 Tax=Cyprinus carpio TaxID=7962 RepID=A0A8C2EQB2_CYPCA